MSGPDLLINPGGPGESGVQWLEQAASGFPEALRSKFNLVSWDPRGVGASVPAVTCVSPAALRAFADSNPVPSNAAQLAAFRTTVVNFDHACVSRTPAALIANISTEATVHDLDRLRAALGEPKLDYLGFSYGTYIGYLFARAFPSHVRAMVLDGAVDPRISPIGTVVAQSRSLEVDLHDFFAWCPTASTCRKWLPHGAAAPYHTLVDRLRGGAALAAHMPAAVGGTQQIHYGTALIGIIAPLYSKANWQYLAEGIASALHGDGTVLASLAFQYEGINPNGTVENVAASNTATVCADHPTSYSLSKVAALAAELGRDDPDFGPADAFSLYSCTPWPVRRPPVLSVAASVGSLRPVVVVGSTRDPVTPYAWAVALTRALPHAILLTRDGDGHTGYFASSCVSSLVDTYFSTLRTPAKGTVCTSTVG